MTPETKLKTEILAYLKRLKAAGEPIWWYKVHGSRYQMAGVPDLDIVYKGLAIKLEAKAGDKQPTKLQEHVMAEIRAAGGVASVVRSVGDVVTILSRIPSKKNPQIPRIRD